MDSKEYEELVADVCGELCSVPGAVIRHNQRLRGNSGHEHQIDVVIEYPGPVRLLILVECKYWTHPVTVEEVLVLAQRLTDTGAHKGIIVTRIGFQPGALKVAQARGIALVRLR